jgi:uncharacterized membrane protein
MTETNSRTPHGDAPLSPAKNANPNSSFELPSTQDAKSYELIGRTVTVARPREELYEFWREFSNLGRFLHNVRSVQSDDPVRAHGVVGAEGQQSTVWDSMVVEDVPNELIAWRADAESQLVHEARVEFRDAPDGRGTVVTATILYDPHWHSNRRRKATGVQAAAGAR